MRCAQHDRGFEIVAHAHAEARRDAVVVGQFAEQREERRGFDTGRGYAHQPGKRDSGVARLRQQRGQVRNRAAALLRFVADVDLDEAGHLLAGRVHGAGERGNEVGPVERVDAIEQRNRVIGLIRLELADKMEADIRRLCDQPRPLRLRVLHPVFAELALAGGDQRRDHFGGVSLGDCDEGHVFGLAPRNPGGGGDARADGIELDVRRWIDHAAVL